MASSHLQACHPELGLKVIEMKNSPINRRQNIQIAALQKKVAQLKTLANLPKKAKRAAKKRLMVNKPATALASQAVALVQPFKAQVGVPQHLIDVLPSQKYTLRSRTTMTVGASQSMFILLSPHAWDETDRPSGVVVGFANNNYTTGAFLQQVINSGEAGSSFRPAGSTGGNLLYPIRPWHYADGRTARLVSYGLRIRYTGTALNANGTLKLLASPHGEFDLWSGATYGSIGALVDSSHHTQMKSVYDRAVYEFGFIGNDEWSEIGTGADQDEIREMVRLGQASSNHLFNEIGAAVTYVNNASSAVQFEIELVEHWEARGPTLAPFYTDSHSDPALHHEIMNIVNTAHTRAGLSTENKFTNVVSTVAKASKSPLGKAVLAAALA